MEREALTDSGPANSSAITYTIETLQFKMIANL